MRERDFRAYVRIGIRVYTDRMLTGLIYIMPLAYECVCVGDANSHVYRDG